MTSTSAIASLPGGDVGQQVEHAFERIVGVAGLPRREQEDLRVEALEGELELVRVAHLDDALEADVVGLLPAPLDVLGVLFERGGREQQGIRSAP